jgi:cytochrome P450
MTAQMVSNHPSTLPYSDRFFDDPYPVYAWYRANRPVAPVQFPNSRRPVWWVTRYRDVRAVLEDGRFSSNPLSANDATAAAQLPLADTSDVSAGAIAYSDQPVHGHRRKRAVRVFTARRVEYLRAFIEATSADLLDALASRTEADLIAHFAAPLPIAVITGMLGVPESDQHNFRGWFDTLISTDPDDAARAPAAAAASTEYIQQLIAENRAHPGDDLISSFIGLPEDDAMSDVELLAMVITLLFSGYETTLNLIGTGTLALIEHPAQLELLRTDPSLVDQAVEEMLRYESPATATLWRYPKEDVSFGGTVIPKGDPVLPMLASANRDPDAFPDPDALDIQRGNLQHVALGHGIHVCLGAALARLEARIAFPMLLSRLPDLRLAIPRDDVRFRHSMFARGVRELPITYTAR